MSELPDAPPLLGLHRGGNTSACLVVVLRGAVESRLHTPVAARVAGPWSDRGDVEEELARVSAAQGGGELIRLPWLSVRGEDVIAAYIEEREGRGRLSK